MRAWRMNTTTAAAGTTELGDATGELLVGARLAGDARTSNHEGIARADTTLSPAPAHVPPVRR